MLVAADTILDIYTGAFAVGAFALVLGIRITVRIIACAVFVAANARNVEIFGLDSVCKNIECGTPERLLGFGFYSSSSSKSCGVDPFVRGQVFFEPCHCRAVGCTHVRVLI